jgi:hypothetical protein
MTILDLEGDLRSASQRLKRRQRRVRRAVRVWPAIGAVAAAGFAAILVWGGDDPRTVTPPARWDAAAERVGGELPTRAGLDSARTHFAILRNAARPEDQLAVAGDTPDRAEPHPNGELIRRVISTDAARVYVAPVSRGGHDEICLVLVTGSGTGTACSPIPVAIDPDRLTGIFSVDSQDRATLVRLLPDGVKGYSLTSADGRRGAVTASTNGALTTFDARQAYTERWISSDGHIHENVAPAPIRP